MQKYLDYTGLSTVWDRIKSYVTSSITSYKTSTRGDDKYVPNGTSVDLTLDNVGLSTTNNLLNSGTHYVALRANSTNPFLGLKQGTNLWYAQAASNYFYFGPTSAKALRLDQNGNGVFQTGSVTATKIIKSGGTSSQFLKADGSVDSNTYLTSFTETDPVFTASAAHGITSTNIINWNNKQEALEYYDESVTSSLTGMYNYASIERTINSLVAGCGIGGYDSDSLDLVGSYILDPSTYLLAHSGCYPFTHIIDGTPIILPAVSMGIRNLSSDYVLSFLDITPLHVKLNHMEGDIYIKNNYEGNTSDISINTNGNIVTTGTDITFNGKSLQNVQANWDESDSSDDSFIKNKPTNIVFDEGNNATSVIIGNGVEDTVLTNDGKNSAININPIGIDIISNYDYQTSSNSSNNNGTNNVSIRTGRGKLLYNNKEVATTDQIVQADWDESDSDDAAYIKNKPFVILDHGNNFTGIIYGSGDQTENLYVCANSNATNSPYINLTPAGIELDTTNSMMGNISVTTKSGGKLLYNNKEVATKSDFIQANWDESDSSDDAFIQNKPYIPKVTTITITKNQQDEWELQNISTFSDFVSIIQNSDEVIIDYDAGMNIHMYFDKVLLYGGAYIFTGTLYFGGVSQLLCFAISEGVDDAIVIEDITSPIPSDSDVVHIANEETITGAKTFSDAVRLNGVASSVDSGSRLLFTSNGVLKGCVSANESGGLNLRNGNGDALYLLNNTLYNRLRAGTALGTVGLPFGTLHTNGTINKYIDGTNEYTLTLPSQTGTLALENNTVAKIGSYYATTTSGYLKIKLNEPVTTMSSIYINLYSSYEHYEYIISGYNYGTTKMWHLPKVTLRSSNKSPRIIYLGYDGDNDLWVAVPHGGNSNVVVSEAANSYLTKTPIKDVTFTWGLSTDTSQWTGTIQKEVTVYPLADLGDLQEIVGDINAVLQLVNFGNDESSSD